MTWNTEEFLQRSLAFAHRREKAHRLKIEWWQARIRELAACEPAQSDESADRLMVAEAAEVES